VGEFHHYNRPMRVTREQWARSASQPRMLLLLLVILAIAALFIRLGAWQLDRAALRGAAAARETEAARLTADPIPLDQALRVGQDFSTDQQVRKVTVSGEFREQVLVPDRLVDGAPATLVVTSLWISDGPDAGAMIPVLRGWVAPGDVVESGGVLRPVSAAVGETLAMPPGHVTVVGFLTDSEQAVGGAFPGGAVGAISTGQLTNLWGGPTFTGFIVRSDSQPPSSLPAVPPPSYSQQTGMNLQNLAYAGEWFLFGGFALFLWWRIVREDAVRRREAELLAATAGA